MFTIQDNGKSCKDAASSLLNLPGLSKHMMLYFCASAADGVSVPLAKKTKCVFLFFLGMVCTLCLICNYVPSLNCHNKCCGKTQWTHEERLRFSPNSLLFSFLFNNNKSSSSSKLILPSIHLYYVSLAPGSVNR